MASQEKVLEWLKSVGTAKTSKQIASGMRIKSGNVCATLTHLNRRGCVVRERARPDGGPWIYTFVKDLQGTSLQHSPEHQRTDNEMVIVRLNPNVAKSLIASLMTALL